MPLVAQVRSKLPYALGLTYTSHPARGVAPRALPTSGGRASNGIPGDPRRTSRIRIYANSALYRAGLPFGVARLDDVQANNSAETARMAGLPSSLSDAVAMVWDFDGVIADTEPAQASAYETVLAEYDVELEPSWFFDYVGTPESEIWQLLRRRYAIPTSARDLALTRTEAFIPLARACQPAWFVPVLLAVNCPHSVVSAGRHEHIIDLLGHWGLLEAFESISAAGSPNEPPMPKPYRLAQACTRGAVLLEDMPKYLKAPLK